MVFWFALSYCIAFALSFACRCCQVLSPASVLLTLLYFEFIQLTKAHLLFSTCLPVPF